MGGEEEEDQGLQHWRSASRFVFQNVLVLGFSIQFCLLGGHTATLALLFNGLNS